MPTRILTEDCLVPVGTHERIVFTDGTVVSRVIPRTACAFMIHADIANVKMTVDGKTDPDNDLGFELINNEPPKVYFLYPGAEIRFRAQNATAGAVELQFLGKLVR